MIEPVGAPCENTPGRSETVISLSATDNANPPVSLASERTVDFSEPFCIGLTASIEPGQTEPGFVFNIMDTLFGESIGFLSIDLSGITFSLGEARADFLPVTGMFGADPEYHHLQICVADGAATLYTNCTDPQTESFETTTTIGGGATLITFFQNSSFTEDNRFTVPIIIEIQ